MNRRIVRGCHAPPLIACRPELPTVRYCSPSIHPEDLYHFIAQMIDHLYGDPDLGLSKGPDVSLAPAASACLFVLSDFSLKLFRKCFRVAFANQLCFARHFLEDVLRLDERVLKLTIGRLPKQQMNPELF